ncbi:peroxisomal membrane protein 2 [Colletes gigas]|uniref:peroxisomal membrane protein 2 n=1 Tax=Colletes gigas TaxID=935657 RepID=UPI001C9A6381|nr:peroxisomal membrane protein 2 [Colletes gigas]
MALSKPSNLFLHFIGTYFEQLYINPVKTKAITSCILATLSNYISQKISGAKHMNHDSLLAYALFGLFFGGPVPHYFYTFIHPFVKSPFKLLLIERCIYLPCFQALALYMLSRLQGNTHKYSCKEMKRLHWHVVSTNLKYLTLLQYINFKYVPPGLRVLMINLISFFWTIYIAQLQSYK